MKSTLFIILFCTAVVQNTEARQNDSDSRAVQQVIDVVFQAFSEGSISKMESVVTTDVNILEHGEVWTLDSIRFYFNKPRPADFKRINKLEFFQTDVKKDMAFVSYWNTAEVHANKKDRTIKWLESAVLVRDGDRWRVKMLHSTRVQY